MAKDSIFVRGGHLIFGKDRLGHSLAYLFALFALLLGLLIGILLSQPSRIVPPTASLIEVAADMDRLLDTAIDDPRRISGEMVELRKKVAAIPAGGRTAPADLARTKAELLVGLDVLETKLAAQSAAYQSGLVEAQGKLKKQRDKLAAIGGRGFPYSILMPLGGFAIWAGPTLVFGAALILLLFLALFHPRTRQIFGRTGSISIGELTINFTDMNSVRLNIRERLSQLDRDISKLYMEKIAPTEIGLKFSEWKQQLDRIFRSEFGIELSSKRHRANLFVPGFAGDELVQATEYLGVGIDVLKTGAGRRFSARYGIIGKCWRLREALYNRDVNNRQNRLIRDWGLTQAEARDQGQGSNSLLAIPLRDQSETSDPLAVIYLEARGKDALRPSMWPKEDPAEPDPDEDELAAWVWREMQDLKETDELVEELKKLRENLKWDEKVVLQPGR